MNRLISGGTGAVLALALAAGACTSGRSTSAPDTPTTTAAGAPGVGSSVPAPDTPAQPPRGSAVAPPPAVGQPASGQGLESADLGPVVLTASAPAVVGRGQLATVAFRTRPGSMCQMALQFATGAEGADQRLDPATAGPDGVVSWTWTVMGSAPPGAASAYVVCSGGARGEARITIS